MADGTWTAPAFRAPVPGGFAAPRRPLVYATFCSGIEGVSVAWEPLECFEPAFFCEIEPFCCEVLFQRWPHVSNYGDLTKVDGTPLRGLIDVVWGSTPCQAFSFAGRRRGLTDKRGALTLAFVERVDEIQPTYVLWENVKGVLSDKSNAFGCLLGALAGEDGPLVPAGGKWTHAGYVLGPARTVAWRLFDAQHGGVPQRRERVFVVASSADGADPRDVLFELEGLRRDTAPRREAGQTVAATLAGGARADGGYSHDDAPLTVAVSDTAGALAAQGKAAGSTSLQGAHQGHLVVAYGGSSGKPLDVATALLANPTGTQQRYDLDTETFLVDLGTPVGLHGTAGTVKAAEGSASRGLGVLAFDARQTDVCVYGDWSGSLDTDGHSIAIAFSSKDHGADAAADLAPTLRAMPHDESHANAGGQLAIAYALRNDAGRAGEAKTPSADAEGRMRLRDAGFNYLEECAPTLDAGGPHFVGYAEQLYALMPQNSARDFKARPTEVAQPLTAAGPVTGNQGGDYVVQALAVAVRGRKGGAQVEVGDEIANALRGSDGGASRALALIIEWAGRIRARVRRLTPVECERLQGLPDNHTRIPWRGRPAEACPDGPRYRAIGNGLATPDVRWIGARLAHFHALTERGPRSRAARAQDFYSPKRNAP